VNDKNNNKKKKMKRKLTVPVNDKTKFVCSFVLDEKKKKKEKGSIIILSQH